MSLYANLLDPSTDAPGIISRAPVVFKQSSDNQPQTDDAGKKQLKDRMAFSPHYSASARTDLITHFSLHSFTSFPTHQKATTVSKEQTEAYSNQSGATASALS